jgi:hypothetical protein
MKEQLTEEQEVDITNIVNPGGDDFTDQEGKPLSKREVELNMKRALENRKRVIKENKLLIEDMELEVAYRKAQSDALKYRFELMDYYLKNIELEPQYLAAVEKSKLLAQEQDNQELNLS